jgi:Protein of unknown function (DUF3429)
VLPFAGLALLTVAAPSGMALWSLPALISYGAIILGFMGGVQWGLELTQITRDHNLPLGYVASGFGGLLA